MDPLILILVLLVFIALPLFQIRKQNQKLKEIRAFQAQLRPGMVVRMTSGIQGRLHHVGEKSVDLEVAPSVVTTWDRTAVLSAVDSVDDGSAQGEALQKTNPSRSRPVEQRDELSDRTADNDGREPGTSHGTDATNNPNGTPEDRL